jgi:hypothetical protein
LGTTAGPHAPRPGWAWRWPRQALALAFASPAGFALLLGSSLVLGAASLALALALPGLWALILIIAAVTAASAWPLLAIFTSLLRRDGHSPLPASQVWSLARPLAMTGYLGTVIIVTLGVFLFPAREAGAPETPEPASLVLGLGLRGIMTLIVTATWINPLWIAAIPGVGLDLAAARHGSRRLVLMAPAAWSVLSFGTIFAGSIVFHLPFALSALWVYLLICWLYVAAREIYGGISENGALSGASEPREVPV